MAARRHSVLSSNVSLVTAPLSSFSGGWRILRKETLVEMSGMNAVEEEDVVDGGWSIPIWAPARFSVDRGLAVDSGVVFLTLSVTAIFVLKWSSLWLEALCFGSFVLASWLRLWEEIFVGFPTVLVEDREVWLDSGGGGIGLTFIAFNLSLVVDSVALSLLRRRSVSVFPMLEPCLAGDSEVVLKFPPSSFCNEEKDVGTPGFLRGNFGVRLGGLEPGL